MKHALDADFRIHVRPPDALTGSDETGVPPLRRAGFGEPPGPGQGDADHMPVDRMRDDPIARIGSIRSRAVRWRVSARGIAV